LKKKYFHFHFKKRILLLKRINNQFKLGSPQNGQVPFIQFNGDFIEGMENIINKLKHLGKPLAENKNEKKVEEIVDNILFPYVFPL